MIGPAPRLIAADAADLTAQMFVEGGDDRLQLDPRTGLNRYLCGPTPAGDAGFGSSTASVVSPEGFACGDALRRRLEAAGGEALDNAYAREVVRIRSELAALCGLSDLAGLQTILTASGTDGHLLAAQLIAAAAEEPIVAVMIEASETGSGIPDALGGRHFSTRTAMGMSVCAGAPIGGRGVADLITLPARNADGAPRPSASIAAELRAVVAGLIGRARVLLIITDVSKTGLLSPDPGVVFALRAAAPDRIDVLVDACQFRLSAAGLRGYLDQDAMVAISGSKFVGGPPFSGALLLPPQVAGRMAAAPGCPGMAAYAGRADMPADWPSARYLPHAVNIGMLMRWDAALSELRAFAALSEADVAAFLDTFAAQVRARLAADPVFEVLPTPALERAAAGLWDSRQTIFPFLLRHLRDGEPARDFSRQETRAAYETLGRSGILLGQPVACGQRIGTEISALRLSASARLVAEGVTHGGRDAPRLFQRMAQTLERLASVARSISGGEL